MKLNPYLGFNGNCRAAFEFYQKTLGGTIVAMMTYGQTPAADHSPSETQDLIIHARLIVSDSVLMGSDSPPDMFQQPQGIHVSLLYDDNAEAERIFNALAQNGQVQMPFEETFWAHGFGMCVDQFGTPWMVNCEKPM
jgi:PhnB protein